MQYVCQALGHALVIEPFIDTAVIAAGLLARAATPTATDLIERICTGDAVAVLSANEQKASLLLESHNSERPALWFEWNADWLFKKSRNAVVEQWSQLRSYVIQTIGPCVAALMLPVVLEGDGVRIGKLIVTADGIRYPYLPQGKKAKAQNFETGVIPWARYCGWKDDRGGIALLAADQATGKSESYMFVEGNYPNAFVLPALLGAVAAVAKDRSQPA